MSPAALLLIAVSISSGCQPTAAPKPPVVSEASSAAKPAKPRPMAPKPPRRHESLGQGLEANVTQVSRFDRRTDSASEFTILSTPVARTGPANWTAEPDPPAEPVAIEGDADSLPEAPIPIGPRTASPGDIVFPSVPSSFVAVGSGWKPDAREVWDLASGKLIGKVPPQDVKTLSNALSPDGRHFAGVPPLPGVRVWLWELEKKKPAAEILFADVKIEWLGFPTADRLVGLFGPKTGRTPPRIGVWEVPSGKEVKVFAAPPGPFQCAAVSPGGAYFAVAQGELQRHVVSLVEITTGQVAGRLTLPIYDGARKFTIRSVAFTPEGGHIAALVEAAEAAKIFVWDLADGGLVEDQTYPKKLWEELDSEFQAMHPLAAFPGGRHLLAYEHLVIDRASGAIVHEIPPDDVSFPRVRWPLEPHRLTHLKISGRQGVIAIQELPPSLLNKSAGGKRPPIAALGDVPLRELAAPQPNQVDSQGISVRHADAWRVEPDPLLDQSLPDGLSLIPQEGDVRRIALATRTSPRAVIQREQHGKPERWLDVYSLESQELIHRLHVGYAGDLESVDPDGRLALLKTGGASPRLDVIDLQAGRHVVSLQIAGDKNRMLRSGRLYSGARLLTLESDGRLTSWQLPEGTVVWTAEQAGRPTLSPGERYVVYDDGANLRFLDAQTGESCGRVPLGVNIGAIAFDPTGARLAYVSDGRFGELSCLDLATRKLATFPVPPLPPPPLERSPVPIPLPTLAWRGPQHVLLGRTLIDVDRQAVAWKYKFTQAERLLCPSSGQEWALVSRSQQLQLCRYELPEGQAAAALAKADLRPKYAFGLGVPCGLQTLGGEFDLSAATAYVQAALEAQGTKIDPQAPVQLILRNVEEYGRQEMQTYSKSMFGGNGQTIPTAPLTVTFHAEIKLRGEVLWRHMESQHSPVPYSLEGRPGESAGQAVRREQVSKIQPVAQFELPRWLLDPQGNQPLGETDLAPAGPGDEPIPDPTSPTSPTSRPPIVNSPAPLVIGPGSKAKPQPKPTTGPAF